MRPELVASKNHEVRGQRFQRLTGTSQDGSIDLPPRQIDSVATSGLVNRQVTARCLAPWSAVRGCKSASYPHGMPDNHLPAKATPRDHKQSKRT